MAHASTVTGTSDASDLRLFQEAPDLCDVRVALREHGTDQGVECRVRVDRTHLGGLSGEGTVVLGGQHQQWLRVDGLFLALSL
jgi:hypothetical protein